MRYGKSAGPIYCRYANTAPVLNSALAREYGVIVDMDRSEGQTRRLEAGRHVKLRMLLNNRQNRLTCHATIDWVEIDSANDVCSVGFSHLSLSDLEFKVLIENFCETSDRTLSVGDSVRQLGPDAMPLTAGQDNRAIVRDKAVTMPVAIIEAIDHERGDTPFSEYVVQALRTILGHTHEAPRG